MLASKTLQRVRKKPASTALAVPPQPVNGFTQAAYLYDSLGVNVHVTATGTSYDNWTNVQAALAEMGIRHVRDGMYGSWYDFRWQFARPKIRAVNNRNVNLPAPSTNDRGHPIFFNVLMPGWAPNNQLNPNARWFHQQTIDIVGRTGGTFALRFRQQGTSATQTTGQLAFNASAATIQAALRALTFIGNNVTVSGPDGGPWVVTYSGTLLNQAQNRLESTIEMGDNLTGGSDPVHSGVRVLGQPNGDATWDASLLVPTNDGGHQHYDGNAGPTVAIKGVGNPIPNGSTVNPNGVPANWSFADAEMPWTVIGGYSGPNEPLGRYYHEDMRGSVKAVRDILKTKESIIANGLPYVTEDGIQTNVKAKQLPMYGICVMDNGLIPTYGKWGVGQEVADLGDRHPYDNMTDPCRTRCDTAFVTQATIFDNNTGQAAPDPATLLPWAVTEMGYISRGISSAQTVTPNFPASGYWPHPDDVIAEYLCRLWLLYHFEYNVRRFFIYEFMDEQNNSFDVEWNFGIVKYDYTRKAQFYSLRNLLRIIGFGEASSGARRKLNILTPTGFTPYGSDGSGQNKQTQAFSGGSVPVGQAWLTHPDLMRYYQAQQNDNTWLYFMVRDVSLFDRCPGNRNPTTGQLESLAGLAAGRKNPPSQNLLVTLPAEITSCEMYTPTAGGTTTPDDGFAPTELLPDGNNRVTVPIAGNMRILKLSN